MSKPFEADLVTALAAIENPSLDGNAAYGKYATIQACLGAAKETLNAHNLAVVQMIHTQPDRLVTRIVHSSGEFVEDGGVPLYCVDQNNPQKMGSAITYARRYGLCALLGIAGEEDDDAQSATPTDQLPDAKKTKAPPVVKAPIQSVETIEETFDAGPVGAVDWGAWVDQHIAGFAKHKHIVEHKNWSKSVIAEREKLKAHDKELYAKLNAAYAAKKSQLENRS
jgi:hypothetical protein